MMETQNELIYNSFSVVFLQSFIAEEIKPIDIKPIDDFIDKQIFTKYEDDLVSRYELDSFNIDISLYSKDADDTPVKLNSIFGEVKVHAAVYFNKAVSLSYRFVVNTKEKESSFCFTEKPFSTDDMILLAGLIHRVEHWNEEKGKYSVSEDQHRIKLRRKDGVEISGGSEIFTQIQKSYKSKFTTCPKSEDSHHVMIDVWDDIAHSNLDFTKMSESDIITHIETKHKSELIGLMSLYPYEWPYRNERDFQNICRDNIAIDTDDIVLTNSKVSLVIGTYGIRGEDAPTVWKDQIHFMNIYHVSWVEYLVLLETAIVKKTTIRYVLSSYIANINKLSDANLKSKKSDIQAAISENADLNIRLTSLVARLDIARYVRYVSHKHMYKKAIKNLNIEEDIEQLNFITSNIDNALNNANNMRELKQTNTANRILMVISIASLLEVVMSEAKIPVLSLIGLGDISIKSGTILIITTFVIILWTIGQSIFYYFKNNYVKKSKK